MSWLHGRLRIVLPWLAWILGVLVLTVVVRQVPFLRNLDEAINRHRGLALGSVIAFGALSFAAFIGGVIYGVATRIPSRGRASDEGNYLPPMGSPTAVWRRTVIRPRPQVAGGSFQIEVSFREIKQAWASGAWRSDRFWRFTFYMMAAGAMTILGIFGIVFVVGDAAIKLLMVGALFYAVVRTAWGFSKA